MPFFGAALLKKSLVGSFFIVGEGREYLRWHWAGGVRAGDVEGTDSLVHPALEGVRGGEDFLFDVKQPNLVQVDFCLM